MEKEIVHIDAKNLYVWVLSLSLPYDETRRDKDVKLEDNLNTPDDSDICYTIECDIKTPDNIKYIPFCPENKFSP